MPKVIIKIHLDLHDLIEHEFIILMMMKFRYQQMIKNNINNMRMLFIKMLIKRKKFIKKLLQINLKKAFNTKMSR